MANLDRLGFGQIYIFGREFHIEFISPVVLDFAIHSEDRRDFGNLESLSML